MRYLVGILLCAAWGCSASSTTSSGGGAPPLAASDDKQALQGKWKIVDSNKYGPARESEMRCRLWFDGDVVGFLGEDDKIDDQWRFTIDASKNPKQMDMVEIDKKGKAKKTRTLPNGEEVAEPDLAIYELNGDELRIAIGGSTEKERPKKVDEEGGRFVHRLRLQRVK